MNEKRPWVLVAIWFWTITLLGTWQRIVLVELSEPRRRTLRISFQ